VEDIHPLQMNFQKEFYAKLKKNKLPFYCTEKYLGSTASKSKNKVNCSSSQVGVLDSCVDENKNGPHSNQNSSFL
jgi:hypothetical protein